jgi:hypothetical protein
MNINPERLDGSVRFEFSIGPGDALKQNEGVEIMLVIPVRISSKNTSESD